MVVAALRLAIGAVALMSLALCMPLGRAGFRRLRPGLVLLAGVAMAGYNLVFFAAIARIGVGVGTALSIGSAPAWVALFHFLRRRQIPPPRLMAGQALCIVGATLLVVTGNATNGPVGGYLLALCCGAAYATYSLATSGASGAAPSTTLAAATFAVAALVCAPALVVLPTAWVANSPAPALLLAMGVGATGLAYALYTWGLRSVAPGAAVTLALIEPLTAWCGAVFILGEAVSPGRLAGAIILLAGLWVITSTVADPT